MLPGGGRRGCCGAVVGSLTFGGMSEENKPRVVWILGAGFSKSLGGPLLEDLFSYDRVQRTIDRDPSKGKALKSVWRVFRCAKEFSASTEFFAKAEWRDAEEFLELLESAAGNGEASQQESAAGDGEAWQRSWKRLKPYLPTARKGCVAPPKVLDALNDPAKAKVMLKDWYDAAIDHFAAACSDFIPDDESVRTLERWEPYRLWYKGLRLSTDPEATDSVITFNYDPVVEVLARACRMGGGADHQRENDFRLVPYGVEALEGEGDGKAVGTPVAELFKLHGSVDWEHPGDTADAPIKRLRSDASDQTSERKMPFLATPGDAKRQHVHGSLKKIWDAALNRIKAADVIIFVGYRFPPSDAHARSKILGAISEKASPEWRVRIVLGPDKADPGLRRMAGLIQWAIGDGAAAGTSPDPPEHRLEPLWAEDYLGLFIRERTPEDYRGQSR